MTDNDVNPNESDSRTSSSLLQRAKLNQQDAWERLVSLYMPLVFEWCRYWGLQSEDAQNVGQETFTAVARKLGKFRRDRKGDTFRGWLRTIAHNKYRDHLRSIQKQPNGIGGSDGQKMFQQASFNEADETEESAHAETKQLYRRAVEFIRNDFSERDWQAFLQVVMLEKRSVDVATDLNMTTNAVYLAKSRILRRVREEFGDLIDGELE